VADTSFVSETAALLADLKARLGLHGEAGKQAMRRGLAGAAVALLHVLFAFLLLNSKWMLVPDLLAPEQAPLTWVLLPQQAKEPKVVPPSPAKESVSTAPTTIVPPKIIRPEEEESNAIDWGLAIGRSLACGANSYEYLTPQGRSACLHRPWNFVYDRYGNIVLEASMRPVQEEKPRNSDIQAHERNTAPECPKNIDPNAPCISGIIGGHP
jgi:hypothetical protein